METSFLDRALISTMAQLKKKGKWSYLYHVVQLLSMYILYKRHISNCKIGHGVGGRGLGFQNQRSRVRVPVGVNQVITFIQHHYIGRRIYKKNTFVQNWALGGGSAQMVLFAISVLLHDNRESFQLSIARLGGWIQ